MFSLWGLLEVGMAIASWPGRIVVIWKFNIEFCLKNNLTNI